MGTIKGPKKAKFGCINAKASLIYVTVPDQKVGRKIAMEIVTHKLAGCVNMIPAIESFYWWESKVENEQEALLLIKTIPEKVQKLMDLIGQIHPYEVPAISGIPISDIHTPYVEWLKEVLSKD